MFQRNRANKILIYKKVLIKLKIRFKILIKNLKIYKNKLEILIEYYRQTKIKLKDLHKFN